MQRKQQSNKKPGQPARQSRKSNKNNSNQQAASLGFPALAAPVAYSSPTLAKAPIIKTGNKASRIQHRELIGNLNGITTFAATSFALNPGLSASFPWLSGVAANYEQYRFHRLRFHYITRSATSYVGSVLLAPEYDALDTAPTTEIAVAMMDGAREDVPWRDQCIDFSPENMFPSGPRKYVRTGSISANADLKTYDAGQFLACAAACADTSVMGKLWVEYDVELYIPQNPNASSAGGIGSVAHFVKSGNQAIATGVGEVVTFETAQINSIVAVNTAGSFVLPSGSYLVQTLVSFSGQDSDPVTCDLSIRVATSAVFTTQEKAAGTTGTAASELAASHLIVSTGSEALDVFATCTSAAGTLVLSTIGCSISFWRVA